VVLIENLFLDLSIRSPRLPIHRLQVPGALSFLMPSTSDTGHGTVRTADVDGWVASTILQYMP
jgi:hypothetical protein